MFKNHCLFDRFFYACKTQVINQMGTKSACKGLAKNCTIYITFPRILAKSRVMCQRNLATKYSTLFQPLQQLLAKQYSYQKRFSFNYILVKHFFPVILHSTNQEYVSGPVGRFYSSMKGAHESVRGGTANLDGRGFKTVTKYRVSLHKKLNFYIPPDDISEVFLLCTHLLNGYTWY